MSQSLEDRTTDVVCPICQAEETIEIPGYVFQQKRAGIIKIQIHGGSTCEHEYVVFIDQDGKARGYELIDFQLKFTARTAEERAITGKLFLEDFLEIFGDFATINVMHAFLFNYKIYFIVGPTDDPKFIDRLNTLFSSYFSPEIIIENLASTIEKKKFVEFDVLEDEYLILDMSGRITNSPWGEKKKFDFEQDTIKKALEIIDADSQALLFQQEIANLKHKAEYIISLLENVEVIYEKDLKEALSKGFHAKVTDDLLDLCTLFIKRRMPDQISLLDRIHFGLIDKLKESLW